MAKGGLLYKGPSKIDGEEIVVIATVSSENRKTGDMIQTWILLENEHPHSAWTKGRDVSICGDCTHRGVKTPTGMASRTCYVSWFGPSAVWRAYQRGSYETLTPGKTRALIKGKQLRMGAYGDPAAAPFELWDTISRYASGHTGYTHQWRTCDPRFANLCMASADTYEDRELARSMGYRVFGIGKKLSKNEVVCPAMTAAKLTCAECLACGGQASKARADITVPLHGNAAVLKAATERWGDTQPI